MATGARDGYLYPNPPPPPSGGGSAVSGSSCVYTAATGEKFDLTPMKHDDHDYTGTTTGGYAYRFNVCGNTVKLCNSQPAPASKWRGTKCNNLGDPSTQSVTLLNAADPTQGLRLQYSQGDICKRQVDGQMEIGSRTVTYEVTCDWGEHPGSLKTIKETSMCEYLIEFSSMHACPISGGHGMLGGRGWRLITLLIVAVVLYCGVGIYLNGRNEGKHGVEAIPHIKYWEEGPGLVRDGLQFSLVHGKAAAEKGKGLAEMGLAKGKVAYELIKARYASQHVPTG